MRRSPRHPPACGSCGPTPGSGQWEFTAVDEPESLSFDDFFADENGERAADMPTTHTTMSLAALDGDAGTRRTLVSRFGSLEQLDQLVQMGMEEGLTQAVSQIDAILGA